MRIPIQSGGASRVTYSRREPFAGIRTSLPKGTYAPKCTCISHGDSTLWECCKFGSDDCRPCVGETTDECCKNLIDGKPSPVPGPVIFAV